MTSGKRLTQEQYDRILSLAGEKDLDGEYRFTYELIAEQLQLNERTVRRVIRQAAVRYGQLTGWKTV